MISLKKILKEISHNHSGVAIGDLVWSHAPTVEIDKKWENWRMESMNKINLIGWTKIADLIIDEESDLESDTKGLFIAGDPAKEPIYGLKIIDEDDGYIYKMDTFVHNKKRVFEK
jgi:hypothetical protein